jgi:NAD(P)-dependent dehydrogenase (short-subunit alcohol dehydrogenase family)
VFDFSGHIVVVTGAAAGIGFRSARRFTRRARRWRSVI